MDMSINQRLANFLYEKKISQEELRIKLGLKTRQQVSNWLNCRDHIPDKHLMGIIRLFPELNANWLIREIGSPLIDQKSLRQINRNEFGFCEECLEKDKEIETLKTLLLKKGIKKKSFLSLLHQKRIEKMTKQNHMTQNWWWHRLNFVINDEVM